MRERTPANRSFMPTLVVATCVWWIFSAIATRLPVAYPNPHFLLIIRCHVSDVVYKSGCYAVVDGPGWNITTGSALLTQSRAGSNYTKLYRLQLYLITITLKMFQINYNYTVSITVTLCGTIIYSAFVNYVFLHVLLNFNILYTIDKQI